MLPLQRGDVCAQPPPVTALALLPLPTSCQSLSPAGLWEAKERGPCCGRVSPSAAPFTLACAEEGRDDGVVHPGMSRAKPLDPHFPTQEGCSPEPSGHGVVWEQLQPGWGRGGPASPGSSRLACWLPRDPGVLPRDGSPE